MGGGTVTSLYRNGGNENRLCLLTDVYHSLYGITDISNETWTLIGQRGEYLCGICSDVHCCLCILAAEYPAAGVDGDVVADFGSDVGYHREGARQQWLAAEPAGADGKAFVFDG